VVDVLAGLVAVRFLISAPRQHPERALVTLLGLTVILAVLLSVVPVSP